MAPNADRCHPAASAASSVDSLQVEPELQAERELRKAVCVRGPESPPATSSLACAEVLANAHSTLKPVPALQEQPEVESRDWRRGLTAVDAVLDRLDIITSKTEEADLIARLVGTEKVLVVSFVNQHVMNLAWRSPDFASCLLESDILLRDGIGVEVCLAILGKGVGLNMNGTDFIPRLAAAFGGRRTAIFGTTEPWIGAAAAALAALGCQVVGKMDGFRPESDYVAEVIRTSPELVILAMGNPKQETVAKAIASSVASPMVIVNGGAIADFLGERFERAPLWLQTVRCEWFFRLLQEPRRLWRRYLLGGASFARCVMLLRLASR